MVAICCMHTRSQKTRDWWGTTGEHTLQFVQDFKSSIQVTISILTSLKFGCGSIVGGQSKRACIESEKQALLLLKQSLDKDSDFLSSWVGDDCCEWHGIGCNNITGHITQLDLQNGNLQGGQIISSLHNLKYLTYLDLSFNNFSEIQIPIFFGTFNDLIYLNLSYSNFEGLVPHHLGNLSNLRCLDLNHNDLLSIDNMGWLSKLSLLEHLDLSSIDLSWATDWLPSINMLPISMLLLHMNSCNLPNNIPSNLPFVNLTSLISLDLGFNNFNSSFPLWVLNNSGLAHLDIGYNSFGGSIPKSIGSLTSLLQLDLSANNFSSPIPKSIGSLTSLITLDFSQNKFDGSVPMSIGRLTSLTVLYLSYNDLQGSIPKSVGRLTDLSTLHLCANKLQGLIPESIGSLTSLTDLDLSINHFQGSIPQSIGNLKSLHKLNLKENSFQGLIPESIGALTSLTDLDLSFNNLQGLIAQSVGNLTSLLTLVLSHNKLSNSVPEALCQLLKLKQMDVSNNHLTGSIPKCFGGLSNLEDLILHSNSWEGSVSEHHFFNLTNLISLYISSNSNLVFNVSSKWVPVFQLGMLYIESVKVGPKFPFWLLTQRRILTIGMRNTSISDSIPTDWFVSVLLSGATSVDLSNNDIKGEQLSLISAVPSGLVALVLSNNRLSGKFPAFLCNFTFLNSLVLSSNKFSGKLPQCLGNLTGLRNLDVMNNNFYGDIPVSLGSLERLAYINLHNNNFQGKLPLSFQNLTELVVFDVGKNNLSDNLPTWTGEQLPSLNYLILRSNNFYGNIPTQLCHHSSIHVLNIAQNQITGKIPACFGNFSAMITGENNGQYLGVFQTTGVITIDNRVMVTDDAKGYELNYTSTLGFLFSIDLSHNNISGEIPEELMNLRNLLNLNLAGNQLAGKIPDKIGKLEKLESLDLSGNKLYGPIPKSLSDLTFLSRLNLSFNNFSGSIPHGNQLQTLNDPSIYAGNNQLCGQIILKACTPDTDIPNVHDNNKADSDPDDERMWLYAGIGPGLLVGFLGFCASLHFMESWRYSYFHFVERVFDRIAVASALLQRKFHK